MVIVVMIVSLRAGSEREGLRRLAKSTTAVAAVAAAAAAAAATLAAVTAPAMITTIVALGPPIDTSAATTDQASGEGEA